MIDTEQFLECDHGHCHTIAISGNSADLRPLVAVRFSFFVFRALFCHHGDGPLPSPPPSPWQPLLPLRAARVTTVVLIRTPPVRLGCPLTGVAMIKTAPVSAAAPLPCVSVSVSACRCRVSCVPSLGVSHFSSSYSSPLGPSPTPHPSLTAAATSARQTLAPSSHGREEQTLDFLQSRDRDFLTKKRDRFQIWYLPLNGSCCRRCCWTLCLTAKPSVFSPSRGCLWSAAVAAPPRSSPTPPGALAAAPPAEPGNRSCGGPPPTNSGRTSGPRMIGCTTSRLRTGSAPCAPPCYGVGASWPPPGPPGGACTWNRTPTASAWPSTRCPSPVSVSAGRPSPGPPTRWNLSVRMLFPCLPLPKFPFPPHPSPTPLTSFVSACLSSAVSHVVLSSGVVPLFGVSRDYVPPRRVGGERLVWFFCRKEKKTCFSILSRRPLLSLLAPSRSPLSVLCSPLAPSRLPVRIFPLSSPSLRVPHPHPLSCLSLPRSERAPIQVLWGHRVFLPGGLHRASPRA
ncbi:hypothetical protein MRV_0119 [Murid herpesvirus 3]|uniref:Uncharacterized protein n=2 Tax=Murid betaherpesvirus 3 TaxID=2560603 RepID=A0A1P8VIZ7_9BETA|nr:hypothetical protein MRV_0119 [Murine roseolovirus]APZ76330.1 hypothetical protein MRV_0119 [Murid betaherpesvirus 3]AYH64730.1 hypothetical protein MRV_0119 [Murid herpesvirus 3]